MCEYFILTKSSNSKIDDNKSNQIITTETDKNVFILPKNNIKYYLDYGLFENNLIEWCKIFSDNKTNMLDIGSHTGTYAISLARNFNHVYAFEPQKMTFYSLCGSIALSNLKNVTCFNFGLGSENQLGKQKLNIISLDGGGSTLFGNKNNNIAEEEIEIKTLDSLDLKNISFIKMDVEDNELNVLLGSVNTLINSNYPKILFEMNQTNNDLINFLHNLHYNIVKITYSSNMFLAEKQKN